MDNTYTHTNYLFICHKKQTDPTASPSAVSVPWVLFGVFLQCDERHGCIIYVPISYYFVCAFTIMLYYIQDPTGEPTIVSVSPF